MLSPFTSAFPSNNNTSFYYPGHDLRQETRVPPTVSRNKLTVPAIIDQAEYDDRRANFARAEKLAASNIEAARLFDIRDKGLVFAKRGRGVLVSRTESTRSVHGNENMRHLIPGFTCWDGIAEEKRDSIYEDYALIGVADGDANVDKYESPVATLDGKRGFALLVDGIKSLNYFGTKPVYPGDPLRWVHPYDKLYDKYIEKKLVEKANQSTACLLPATQETLHLKVGDTYKFFVGGEFENHSYKDLVQAPSNKKELTPQFKMALSEYLYLKQASCVDFEIAFREKKVAWLGDKKYSQAQVDIALQLVEDLKAGKVSTPEQVQTVIGRFDGAVATENKLEGAPQPIDYAKYVGFMGDAKPNLDFFNRMFECCSGHFGDKPSDSAYNAMKRSVPVFAYDYRFHHLANTCSLIVGYSTNYVPGKVGGVADVIVRNRKIAASNS